jgi:leucyl aminopeptidase
MQQEFPSRIVALTNFLTTPTTWKHLDVAALMTKTPGWAQKILL